MIRRFGVIAGLIVTLLGSAMQSPSGWAADVSKESVVKYLLTTVQAYRTLYVKGRHGTREKGRNRTQRRLESR